MKRRPAALRGFKAQILILGFLVASFIAGGQTLAQSCDTPDGDDPNAECAPGFTGDFELVMDCGTGMISTRDCAGDPEPAGLLRVAVRCFDPDPVDTVPDDPLQSHGMVAEEARYTDLHDFNRGNTFSLAGILGSSTCDDYIVSAHWTNGTHNSQVQCAIGAFVPECEAPTVEDLAEFDANFPLYSWILPQGGDYSCLPVTQPFDISRVELRNTSRELAVQGVLAGRYMCSSGTGVLTPCDNPFSGTLPNRGQYGHVAGFSLAAEANAVMQVNSRAPGTSIGTQGSFNLCCDHEGSPGLGGDCPSGLTNDPECSPRDVICGSATIFGVCRDDPEDPSCSTLAANFVPLNPVIWLGPRMDHDPGDYAFYVAPPNVCLDFSFADLNDLPGDLNNEFVRELNFDFGPAPTPAVVDDLCDPSTDKYKDVDFDGVYDACDFVVGSNGTADGTHEVLLRRGVRNQGFGKNPDGTNIPFAPDDQVTIGGVDVDESWTPEALVFTVPAIASLDSQTITVVGKSDALQDFSPAYFGYVADGGTDRLLVFDSLAGMATDRNASPTNSDVNLNCSPSDEVTQVMSPWDLASQPYGESGLEGIVVTVNEVEEDSPPLPPEDPTRLFVFSTQEHRLIGASTGESVPGARAVDLAKDPVTLEWKAWMARKLGNGQFALSARVIDPDTGPGSIIEEDLSLDGYPIQVRVRPFNDGQGTSLRAYVTSFDCVDSQTRELSLDVVDLENTPQLSHLVRHTFSSLETACQEDDPGLADLQNAGMDFTVDGTKLLVANPDQSRIEVLDTSTLLLEAPIPVGSQPTDVAVVETYGAECEERAYITSRGDHTIRVLQVEDDGSIIPLATSIDLERPGGDPNVALLEPVAIRARADGRALFTANLAHDTVTMVDIDTNSPTENMRLTEIPTESSATRLTLLEVPAVPVDTDADGVEDCPDNCPIAANPSQDDFDGDALGDACDPDDDNDTVADGSDVDPLDPLRCQDLDGDTCDDCSAGSGPDVANDGSDFDQDGLCDLGDPDDDNDTVSDGADTNPFDPFQCQDLDGDTCDDCSAGSGPDVANDGSDFDQDGLCDLGDPDDDNDTVPDGADSNPFDPFQCQDVDGDACDDCSVAGSPNTANDGFDRDLDGICNLTDEDDDADGILDVNDNCTLAPNPLQEDFDGDGQGDACDFDDDDDGVVDLLDNCVLAPNAGQEDQDGDGAGDACDLDDDDDGVFDGADNCPLTPNPSQADWESDGIGDACDDDKDNDGFLAGNDCLDFNAGVNPGVVEDASNPVTCFDFLDNDCDGVHDIDCAVYATSEILNEGSGISGSTTDLSWVPDGNGYRIMEEKHAGGGGGKKFRLEAIYTLPNAVPNASYEVYVEGFRSIVGNDSFDVDVGTISAGTCDGSESYTTALTLTKTADDDTIESANVGSSSHSTYCIRVIDTKPNGDAVMDQVSVDRLLLFPPQP